jgi:alkylated DNA repair dioxygenase AlkB
MNIISNKEMNGEHSVFVTIDDFLDDTEISKYEQCLIEMGDWKNGFFYGNCTPRLQKWFQDDDRYFSHYWWNKTHERWMSHKSDDWLVELRNKVQKKTDEIFKTIGKDYIGCYKPKLNSSLLNFYRDGNDYIKYHKDDERIFGDNPTISMLTFGVERELIFKRTFNKDVRFSYERNPEEDYLNQRFTIKKGSLFLMMGTVQKYYCHGVEKDESITDARFSLTFREHKF